MFDFAGADAESERADPAMAGGVAIAAYDRGAWQGETLFGTHNMDNSLLARGRAEIAYAEFRCVHCERFELLPALLVSDWYGIARFVQPRRGWQVVIRHRQRQFGPAYLAPLPPQCLESLRAGHFMDQVAVDKDQAGA